MKRILFSAILCCIAQMVLAQTTISGNVTDGDNGDPLIGASVIIQGTTTGTITDINGNYSLKSDTPLPWTLEISYTGYSDQTMQVSSATSSANVNMSYDAVGLDQVVISASRRAEKVTEAVASVSVLGSDRVDVTPLGSDVSEVIRNVPGVNIVRSGTQYSNIELRGAATVNESNTLVMRDYAPLTDIANKRVNTATASVNAIDLARVEVVRGPAGALYGPNVTSGVVHYISKDPFKYTGTDVLVGIGEQNMLQTALRHAGNVDNKFGYKILASYQRSTDFALDTADLINNVGNPSVVAKTMATLGDKVFENVDNLDQDLFQWNITGQLDYRFTDDVSLTYVGSLARQRENFRNQTSHLFVGRQVQQHQLRLTAGNLFVSFFRRNNMGNVDKDGNPRNVLKDYVFNLNYGQNPNAEGILRTQNIGDGIYNDISAQYNLDLGDNLEAVIGADYKNAPTLNDIRVYGINIEDSGGTNSFGVYGGYASLKYKVSDNINLNAAARVDHYDAYGATAFSPRIGAVYKIDESNSVRVNFSRSSQSESRLRTWLDFTIPLPGALPETHVVGVGQEVSYDNPVTQFAFGQVPGGEQYELADIISALASTAGLEVDLSGVSGTVSPSITGANFTAPMIGRPVGSLSGIDATGQGEPTLRFVNQIEVGYKGVINEKLALSGDVYYNITQNLQPPGLIPVSAGAQLDTDAVAQQISGALPGVSQMIVDSLITILNTSAAGPPRPGWGLVVSDRAQENGYLFDTGFPTFGNEDVTFFGVDLGATYYIDDAFSVWTNYSFVSKNIWTPEELGEENPNFEYFLNTPTHRANFGISYLQKEGIYGRFAGNFASEYEGKQGDGRLFTGINEARTIFDFSLGYRLGLGDKTKFDLGLTVNNVFNTKYKHFVHMPVIQRLAMLNLRASF